MRGAVITGWGVALPEKTMTNSDLEARLDTSDEWIRTRTGIRERRIGDSTNAIAIEAGRAALDSAGLEGADVDLVIVATSTPDQQLPASASAVQGALDIAGGAFDLNAACSGFVYALVAAHGMIATGADRVLVIGAETMSRMVDWEDRNTAVLFGDGAGAVVLEATDGPGQLLGNDLGSDGSAKHLLYADLGGYMIMDGKELFRRAVRATVESSTRTLEMAGFTGADVDLAVPHQANVRIVDAACQRLGIPVEKTANVLFRTGNTSAASIPIALVDSIEKGQVHDGDLVLLVGFGAGMSWASALIRWGADRDRVVPRRGKINASTPSGPTDPGVPDTEQEPS